MFQLFWCTQSLLIVQPLFLLDHFAFTVFHGQLPPQLHPNLLPLDFLAHHVRAFWSKNNWPCSNGRPRFTSMKPLSRTSRRSELSRSQKLPISTPWKTCGGGSESQHFQHTQAQNITLGDVLVLKHCQEHRPEHRAWRRFVTGRRPPAGGPFLFENIVKITIFNLRKRRTSQIAHPVASGPGGIRASNLEAPCQNCLVVQRAAKPSFGPPYLPPRGAFWDLYVSIPPPPHPL